VNDEIHQQWKENVVKNPKVLGLFAGHLHDWRRESYSGSLSKLCICPPLATKLQDKSPSQARGFQEVVVEATGNISRTIFWFDAANNTFTWARQAHCTDAIGTNGRASHQSCQTRA
jgi:hypothetical protein